jgi:Tfp pilus assembly protein PilF
MLKRRALSGAFVLAAAGCGGPRDASPAEAHPGFVGAEACAPCHAEETEKWRRSDHFRAMAPADAANVVGDFSGAKFEYHGVASTFSRVDGKYVVRTDDKDGSLRDFPVAYAFGFRPLQQYLLDVGGGRLQSLNVCWDTRPKEQGGQRWFHLYPDENVDHAHPFHWTGPYQNWNAMCAECHSTDLVRGYDAGTDTYRTTWSELVVSCEACHGPGARHVAWASARQNRRREEDEDPREADPLLDVRFPRDLNESAWTFEKGDPTAKRVLPGVFRPEIETCARCHARRGPNRARYAFGRPLADSYDVALLDRDLYHADGQIKEEVYEYGSFLQAKMYRRGVSCRDCHDVHTGKVAFEDNRLCTRCHLSTTFDAPAHHFHEQGTQSARCVECHMRPRNFMVVDARRDHSLRVPRPDLTIETGSPNACNDCHAKESPQWAADWMKKWYGEKSRIGSYHYGKAMAAARDAKPGAGRLLLAAAADAELAPMPRATALALLRGFMGPDAYGAVVTASKDDSPLVRLGAARTLDALPPPLRLRTGLALLADDVRGVRIEAAQALADVPREALAPADAAAIDRGVAEYVEAQLVNADRAEAHANVGVVESARGDLAAAETQFRTALAMRPSFDRVAVNLADVLRRTGRDAEGEKILREALARTIEPADVHLALGLLLVRLRRIDEAVAELTKAVESRPDDAHAAYVLAVALEDTGRPDRAAQVLRAAQARRPADRELLAALAESARRSGDLDAEIDWTRKLAAESMGDPGAAQAVEALERQRRK